jgi:hypothetical protein
VRKKCEDDGGDECIAEGYGLLDGEDGIEPEVGVVFAVVVVVFVFVIIIEGCGVFEELDAFG